MRRCSFVRKSIARAAPTFALSGILGVAIGASAGCGFLVGFQNEDFVAESTDAGAPGDASALHEASLGDDDTRDATTDGDASALGDSGEAADAIAAVDAGPPPAWEVDPTFGSGGWILLNPNATLEVGSLPAIAVDISGAAVDLAATFAGATNDVQNEDNVISILTLDTSADGGALVETMTEGHTDDLLPLANGLFVIADAPTAAAFIGSRPQPGLFVTDVLDAGDPSFSSNALRGTVGVRGFAASSAGPIVVVANDNESASAAIVTVAADGTTAVVDYPSGDGGAPDIVTSGALTADGTWIAGATIAADQSAASRGGRVARIDGDGGQMSSADFALDAGFPAAGVQIEDVAAADGGVLVLGVAGSTFFDSFVTASDTAPVVHSTLAVPGASAPFQYAPSSRNRLVSLRDGGHLAIAALSSEAALALAVIDSSGQFTDDFATASFRAPGPAAATSVVIGGAAAVTIDASTEYVYVAASVVVGTRRFGLLRLVHHTAR